MIIGRPDGVEPICRVLPIAPSTYFRRKAEQTDPTKRSARAIRDEVLQAIILRIWREHDQAYGAHNVWKQMGREGLREARCRVRRLMRALGLRGVVRGRAWTTTTPRGDVGGAARRSRQPSLSSQPSESALGGGFHVRRDVERFRLTRGNISGVSRRPPLTDTIDGLAPKIAWLYSSCNDDLCFEVALQKQRSPAWCEKQNVHHAPNHPNGRKSRNDRPTFRRDRIPRRYPSRVRNRFVQDPKSRGPTS